MNRLTKELTLISSMPVASGVASNELDFNLARRSGVIVNHIQSIVMQTVDTGTHAHNFAQEIDMDPDNVDVLAGSVLLGASFVEMDSSRIFRHQGTFTRSEVATGPGSTTDGTFQQAIDFRMLPLADRPLSITNLRHNLRTVQTVGSGLMDGIIVLKYLIVELTLEELGIVNAGRR